MPQRRWIVVGAVIVVLGAVFTDASGFAMLVAVLAGGLIFKVGLAMLGGMAQPVPEPPPPGELRKVKIQYRCSICGSELRMTVANDEMPDPPRHCLEDMDLVAPVE
jgi:hypothetical protein